MLFVVLTTAFAEDYDGRGILALLDLAVLELLENQLNRIALEAAATESDHDAVDGPAPLHVVDGWIEALVVVRLTIVVVRLTIEVDTLVESFEEVPLSHPHSGLLVLGGWGEGT